MILLETVWHSEELSKILQSPEEPYQNFISHFLQTVSHIIVDGDTETLLSDCLLHSKL